MDDETKRLAGLVHEGDEEAASNLARLLQRKGYLEDSKALDEAGLLSPAEIKRRYLENNQDMIESIIGKMNQYLVFDPPGPSGRSIAWKSTILEGAHHPIMRKHLIEIFRKNWIVDTWDAGGGGILISPPT